jgi:hypothetical protein
VGVNTERTVCRVAQILGKADTCPPGACAFAQPCRLEPGADDEDAVDPLVEMRRTVELLRS